jgi:FG-GAP repeat
VGTGPCVTTADVNGDGCADLISANAGNNMISVLTNIPAVLTNTGSGVVISWPSPSTGFVLQQNSNLAPTNWTTFGGIVNSNATTMSVTNALAPGAQFYRLFHF